ncbi:MAG: hypothetical protein HY423_16150 [Candidatus Lambdaproteobacteria bacterium]|nr:hypothetical protein [Candidatus Lambdaproteobacteria bacterium]
MEMEAQAEKGERSLSRGVVAVVAVILAMVLVLLGVMLAYSMYQHDIRTAEQTAERTSRLLTTSILSTMIRTGNRDHVRALMRELKVKQDFGFRIYRSKYVEEQYGIVEDERPGDTATRHVFETQRPYQEYPNDTTLRHFTPLITDERCAQCHQDLAGKPIQPGIMLGAYEIIFDLSRVKAASLRLIVEVLLLVAGSLLVFGVLLYRVISSNILDPIEQLVYVVEGWARGDFSRTVPTTNSRDLRRLSNAVRRHMELHQPAP